MGKGIHWELYQKFKFHYTNKWYILKSTFASGNDTHKLLWDFFIKTDNLISARRPNFISINIKKNRTCQIVDFTVPAYHSKKLKEMETKVTYLNLVLELKKLWNMKVTIIPIVIDAVGIIIKGLIKGLEEFEIRGRVETMETTTLLRSVRILRNLKSLVVTQTSVIDHKEMLMWKNPKKWIMIIIKIIIITRGHDGIHWFWFKKFTSIQDRLALEMKRCLHGAHVPEGMPKGKTVLIQKDPLKGNVPNKTDT